jgi:hypothetical protein
MGADKKKKEKNALCTGVWVRDKKEGEVITVKWMGP